MVLHWSAASIVGLGYPDFSFATTGTILPNIGPPLDDNFGSVDERLYI